MECKGSGAAPPAMLAKFTLAGIASAMDFYDMSLVDRYNLPVVVDGYGGAGGCAAVGCVADLNQQCPVEPRVREGEGEGEGVPTDVRGSPRAGERREGGREEGIGVPMELTGPGRGE